MNGSANDMNDDAKNHDDYLWDKSGEPDPDVARLEQQLGGFRGKPGAHDPARLDAAPATGRELNPVAPLRPIRWHRVLGRTLAVAAALFVAVSLWHGYAEPHEPVARPGGYRFEPLSGVAVLERLDPGSAGVPVGKLDTGALMGSTRDIEPGHRVVTNPDARGRLVVGDIGSVTLEGNSWLRVEQADALPGGDAQYALYLERGTLEASIFAAPRIFQVGTPSGIAVDMGCVYRTTVDDEGRVWLAVELGQVSFETELDGRLRKVLVPEGASCRAWPGRGAGTPVWNDATDAYREAVESLDTYDPFTKVGLDDRALKEVIAGARPKDTLTLWHLLDHAHEAVRDMAYDRLARLSPPPVGVTRDGVLAGDESMRKSWRKALGWSW